MSKVRYTAYGCWEFTSCLNKAGYALFYLGHGHMQASRAAYILMVGPIPEGMFIDHLCRNLCCVNPKHLEPVTPSENVRRGMGRSGCRIRSAHCRKGHEFTPENTIYQKGGKHRSCRTCRRAYDREYQKDLRRRRSRPTFVLLDLDSAEL